MDEQTYRQIMATSVDITCEQLTDIELNALYMSTLLATNPKNVKGYEKVADLFTENIGTRMHPVTLDAFKAVWEHRCGKRKQSKPDVSVK